MQPVGYCCWCVHGLDAKGFVCSPLLSRGILFRFNETTFDRLRATWRIQHKFDVFFQNSLFISNAEAVLVERIVLMGCQTIGGIVSKETMCCVGGKVKH